MTLSMPLTESVCRRAFSKLQPPDGCSDSTQCFDSSSLEQRDWYNEMTVCENSIYV